MKKNGRLLLSKSTVKHSVCVRMEKALKVSVRGMGRGELSVTIHSFALFYLLNIFITLFIIIANKIIQLHYKVLLKMY